MSEDERTLEQRLRAIELDIDSIQEGMSNMWPYLKWTMFLVSGLFGMAIVMVLEIAGYL